MYIGARVYFFNFFCRFIRIIFPIICIIEVQRVLNVNREQRTTVYHWKINKSENDPIKLLCCACVYINYQSCLNDAYFNVAHYSAALTSGISMILSDLFSLDRWLCNIFFHIPLGLVILQTYNICRWSPIYTRAQAHALSALTREWKKKKKRNYIVLPKHALISFSRYIWATDSRERGGGKEFAHGSNNVFLQQWRAALN